MNKKGTKSNKLAIGLLINIFSYLLREGIPYTFRVLVQVAALVLMIWGVIEMRHKNCA